MIIFWLIGGVVLIFGLVVVRGAPYVPTHKKQLKRLFSELLPLTDKDIVVDLGAGDGIVLKTANEQGAGVIGYELNPLLVLLMKVRFLHHKNITVKLRDYLTLDKLPEQVTIVYIFATGRDIEKVHKKMLEWSKYQPLMLVSYGFTIKDKQPEKALEPFTLYRYE